MTWYYLPKGTQTAESERVEAPLIRIGYALDSVLTFQVRGAQNYYKQNEWKMQKWFFGKQYLINGMETNKYKFISQPKLRFFRVSIFGQKMY